MLKFSIFRLFALLLLCSCTKDELIKPVSVALLLEMESSTEQTEGALKVEGGQFLFREIGFEGYRENGENYFFTKEFPDSLQVYFSDKGGGHIVNFDMPRGVYSSISIKLEVPEGKERFQAGNILNRNDLKGGVEVWGSFVNVAGEELPFLFVYTALNQLNFTAESATGDQQLIINDKGQYHAKLKFNPQQWMELIHVRMLQSARLSTLNGVPTVVISKSQNAQIYNLLANRIATSAHLLIE